MELSCVQKCNKLDFRIEHILGAEHIAFNAEHIAFNAEHFGANIVPCGWVGILKIGSLQILTP